MRRILLIVLLSSALAAGAALADDPPAEADAEEKVLSGMSIVGNDEAPKALVIVPWKSSELGGALDLAYSTRVGPQPVDREVFSRSLSYWEVRVGRSAAPEGRK